MHKFPFCCDLETPRFPLSTKSILKDSLAPKRNPKRHKHVQLDIPLPSVERQTGDDDLPPKKPPRLRKARQNPESSMMRSISNVNPNMSVMESALGHSVIPLRRKMKKFGKRGHRILCLDGGGVKVGGGVCSWCGVMLDFRLLLFLFCTDTLFQIGMVIGLRIDLCH